MPTHCWCPQHKAIATPASVKVAQPQNSRDPRSVRDHRGIRGLCAVTVRGGTARNRSTHILTQAASAAAAAGDGICPAKSGLATQLLGQLTPPPITKTDEQFAANGLEFVYSHEGINLEDLNDLFGQVGFPRRDPAKLQLALEHTHQVLWVRATKQTRWARKGQLLGFARATSDNALFGTIWDVAVTPSWQRSGIGRGAVERLTSMLLAQDIATISLYAEPGVVKLYERLGFEKDLDKIRGMSFQRKGDIGRAIMSKM